MVKSDGRAPRAASAGSHRHTYRCLTRSRIRRVVRTPFRLRWRSRDDLAEAMACYRRAIRAHRRLNRLAPHEFDAAVVDRDRREREERRAWTATWQPAIEKAYGPPTPEERERYLREEMLAAQPPPLHPRTRRAVEREYAAWQLWMETGRQAWARHQQRRPHAVPSLSRVARLLEISIDFGCLAVGLDSRRSGVPDQPASPPQDVEADLRRAYGNRSSIQTALSPAPAVPEASCSSNAHPQSVVATAPPSVAPPARPFQDSLAHSAPADPQRRRDAWSSWTRYCCRQTSR